MHTFRPCQCLHPAHPIKASVIAAKMGRYGSIAIKAEADPNPSITTINGPIQQADAKPPAKIAPTKGVFLFFDTVLFKINPLTILEWDMGHLLWTDRIDRPAPQAHFSFGIIL